MRTDVAVERPTPTPPTPRRRGRLRLAEARARALVLRHPYRTVFVVAVVARIAVAIGLAFVISPVDGAIFADDGTYADLARSRAAGEHVRWDPYSRLLFQQTGTFTVPLWLAFEVSGSTQLVGQVLVAAVGALAAVLAARLVADLTGRRTLALVAGLTLALYPSNVLWSSLTMKDAFVWAVALGLALCVLRLLSCAAQERWAWLIVVFLLLFLMSNLREHSFVVAVYCATVSVLWIARQAPRVAVAMFGIAMLLPMVDGFGPFAFDYVGTRGSLEVRRYQNAFGAETAIVSADDPRTPEVEVTLVPPIAAPSSTSTSRSDSPSTSEGRPRTTSSTTRAGGRPPSGATTSALGSATTNPTGGPQEEPGEPTRGSTALTPSTATEGTTSTTQPEIEISRVGGLEGDLRYLPRGLAVMLLEPYPWISPANSRIAIARAEHLIWYPVLVMSVVGLTALLAGIRRGAAARGATFALLYGGGMTVLYALAEGNFGTAFRHRSEIIWVGVVLGAVGVSAVLDRWPRRAPATGAVD